MRNNDEPLFIAPWLFGTSIFQKRVDTLPSLLDALENNPIDTFCGSSSTYQLLRQPSERPHRSRLEQLFSTQPIDPDVKARWYSLTQLNIHDGLSVICFVHALICIVHLDYADLSSRSLTM
jgi:acyl-coenzyme A synthetase/AMP-(fatty) acid ligase